MSVSVCVSVCECERVCAVLSQGSWVQSFTQSRFPSVGTSGRQPEEFLGKHPVIRGITC